MIDLGKTMKLLSMLYQEGVVDMFDLATSKNGGGSALTGQAGPSSTQSDSNSNPAAKKARGNNPTSSNSSTGIPSSGSQPIFVWCLIKSVSEGERGKGKGERKVSA